MPVNPKWHLGAKILIHAAGEVRVARVAKIALVNQTRAWNPVCDNDWYPTLKSVQLAAKEVARYLHERGVATCGIDLSPGMVERARELNPGVEFRQGDMRSLDVLDEAWAGIATFYAIVNLPPVEVAQAMREMWRVLRPGGLLLLSFHIGEEIARAEDLWGCAVCLDFYFFQPEDVAGNLAAIGFELEEIVEREPYAPDVEYQSRRAYIFARKPLVTTTSI